MIVQENTPYIATLNRGKGFFRGAKYHVVIEKEGYATREIDVEGRLSGWYLGGNLIFGGLIGYLIVDPASGAMWTLTPKEVDAELGEQTTLLMQDEGLMVVLSQQVPPALQQKMKPVN